MAEKKKKRKAYKTHAEIIRTITSTVSACVGVATFIIVALPHI